MPQHDASPEEHAENSVAKEEHGKRAKTRIERRRRDAVQSVTDGSRILVENEWQDLRDPKVAKAFVTREMRTGLALSGGGIRSATISLGLIEALAARGRFYSIDLLSTVSGGGYCGSFVKSLYVDRDRLGDVVTDRAAFADATLTSLPDQQFFRGDDESTFVVKGKTIKNPLWWLRENGRYLAPGGMSDYGYALSYIIRNWATLLVYVLAVMMVAFSGLQLILLGLRNALVDTGQPWAQQIPGFLESSGLLSPLWPLLFLTLIIGIGIGAAYWLSLPLPFARSSKLEMSGRGRVTVAAVVILLGMLIAATVWLHMSGKLPQDLAARLWAFGLLLGLVSVLISGAITLARVAGTAHSTRVDFRREQTRLLARFNGLFVVLLVATVIDWMALWLRQYFDEGGSALLSAGVLSSALVSITSFLVAKLPDWLGGEGSSFRKFLVDHARQGALVAGVVILASIALLADMLVLKLLWRGTAWTRDARIEWDVFGVAMGLIGLLALLWSRSLNFVNLLGLTPFYGSRLCRAYLGASNATRLDTRNRSEVTEGLVGDDIELQDYMAAGGPAPLHLINATRNRTVGDHPSLDRIDVSGDDPLVREDSHDPRGRLPSYESSLTLHDRHGDRVVFGPFGVRVGAEFFPLEHLKSRPSLGLLCAISGAAVGSGMGRLTSLGTAMAMTLANVRLGYWWKAQEANPPPEVSPVPLAQRLREIARKVWNLLSDDIEEGEEKEEEEPNPAPARRRNLLPGLSCLYNELLGRFSTNQYWYLSDGGHSENSGALTLLERGCQFILVCDNAQDPEYRFGDLEIFIRTARTDIGMEVAVVSDRNFPPSLRQAKKYFFNGSSGDWRARARDDSDETFALLLRATDIPHRSGGTWRQRHAGRTWIVWLKPNRFSDLPADLATYGELHPDYPQQPTSNQFFDEAQWESYRRLGFEMGRRLFARPETLGDYLPLIYRTGSGSKLR